MKALISYLGYFASEDGRIFRHGIPLKGTPNSNGYLRVFLRINNETKTRYIHRLVCEAFHGPCPHGMECRHLNGNRTDNRACNLEWSDKTTNESDKFTHGTVLRGEKQWASKLTDHMVLAARARAKAGEPIEEIAASFGFPYPIIASAIMGRRWKHLPGALETFSTRRKFSPEQVREIRQRASEGPTRLARAFGVTENAIRQIVRRESYAHIE